MTKTAAANVVAFQASKPIRRKINLRTPLGDINSHLVEVVHTEDPKQALFKRMGEIPAELVQFSRILVAIYQPPVVEKTAGGIILTDTMKKDDLREYYWQGKVGLIVAKGPQAYVDDDHTKFHGASNEVGDWVWFRPSDGMACEVNEVFCRLMSERDIIGKVPHPDCIW
jgi:co-chaperonin GroES (HSP10)